MALVRVAAFELGFDVGDDAAFVEDPIGGDECFLVGVAGQAGQVIDAFQKKDVVTGVPVIVISAKEEKEIKEVAKEIGAVAYIRKPVDRQKLIELVKKHIK